MDILLATFQLGRYLCAVPAADVQEVLMEQPCTPVPRSPSCISGLINLRGQVVCALDLRQRLDLPPPTVEPGQERSSTSVVVRWQDEVWCLVVDRIGDVMAVSEDLFEAPPETLRGPMRALISGAYKLDGALLLALDMHQLLAISAVPVRQ